MDTGTALVCGRRVANICPHPEISLSLTTHTIDIWSVEAKDAVKHLVMSKQPLRIRIDLALDISVARTGDTTSVFIRVSTVPLTLKLGFLAKRCRKLGSFL